MSLRLEQRRQDRCTIWVRGKAALRLDAVAWALFLEDGASTAAPSRTDAIRELLLRPERFVSLQVHECVCERCGDVFGAPWCWTHGEIRKGSSNEQANPQDIFPRGEAIDGEAIDGEKVEEQGGRGHARDHARGRGRARGRARGFLKLK